MSRFALKESTLTIREQSVRVRELTQGERSELVKVVTEDKFRGPAFLVSVGCIDPKFSEEEARQEPADVIKEIADTIRDLSGMGDKEAKKD